MSHHEWPRIAGQAIFSLLAASCAAFLMASGDLHKSVMGAGLLLLATGQFLVIVASSVRLTRAADRQNRQAKALNDLAEQAKSTAARLDDFEARLDVPAPAASDQTLAEMQVLRQQLQDLVNDIQKPQGPPVMAAPREAPQRERLDLLLEPVIDLSTGETAHYRALLNMVNDAGDEVVHADLMRRAEENGVRQRLDLYLMRQVIPVFRKLRARHPSMKLFVPVGAATLMTVEELDDIIILLEGASDIAPGLVVDFTHDSLAILGPAGIEGLARLGRLGVTMALSRVSRAGLDLLALRQLGVRYLDINADHLQLGNGHAASWAQFASFARYKHFEILIGHIATESQAQAAANIARYGYGPCFAPPRRVRPDAVQAHAPSKSQAA